MKTILIDNYDSFTYNLRHLLLELGADTDVVRNDQFALDELESYDNIVLSPGPGIPSEAGQLLNVLRTYAGKKPILGICLGHQAIGEVFGAHLTNLPDVFHGVQTPIRLLGNDPLFEGLEPVIPVGRYHSWVVDKQTLPDCLEVTALSEEGYIMALRHKTLPIHGLQFHPESVLTPHGRAILSNWMKECTHSTLSTPITNF